MPNKITDCPRLISVKDAADQLSVHPKTVRRHFDLVRIGHKAMVRVEDIRSTVNGGGRADV